MATTPPLPTIYWSGALTGVPDVEVKKAFYESLAAVAAQLGFSNYLPHQNSDPTNDPDITPEAVYQMDNQRIEEAGLVVAYLGQPSLGVGMELVLTAIVHQIPLILVYEKSAKVSRMARGVPGVRTHIVFEDEADATAQLHNALSEFAGDFAA